MKNLNFEIHIFVVTMLMFGVIGILPKYAHAQASSTQTVVQELNSKILDQNKKIQQIQAEINQYKTQVTQVGKEANTLQNAIKTLNTSGKQLQGELALTHVNIDKAQLTLQQLDMEISAKQRQINRDNAAIAETIRSMNEIENTSVFVVFLSRPDFSSIWTDLSTLDSLKNELGEHITLLKEDKILLYGKLDQTSEQKKQLASYVATIADKKMLVEINKKEKASLLTQTKEQESKYKQLLAQKQAEEQLFENELFKYESQLQIVIDKSKIVAASNSVLNWPADHFTVTQVFGKTIDAQRLYSNGTHNGIDLGIPVGTPLKASLTGTVVATGNTDLQAGCYSYGKWVLIKHDNGLSTLYGHMSIIKVVSGQAVSTGEIIGYAGQTGYATGPHLHFTVYASQGVRVQQYTASRGCKQMFIPIADPKAYLDPMQYLPRVLAAGARI